MALKRSFYLIVDFDGKMQNQFYRFGKIFFFSYLTGRKNVKTYVPHFKNLFIHLFRKLTF